MLDKIILGHNQFFGVNHLDSQTGNVKEAYFNDISRILDIIRFSFQFGVHSMMMSTHERAIALSHTLQNEPVLGHELGIYLLVPYIAKYVKQANEKGLVNIIRDSLVGTSFQSKLGMFWRGGLGYLKKDIRGIITTLVDFEIAPFSKLNLKAIFLHDALTDLILSWEAIDVLQLYYEHIEKKYGVIPAFCTKNLPRLLKELKKIGIQNPLVMASINKIGYQVNPSLEAFEKALNDYDVQLLAMSTLAAGYLKPLEAYDYLYALPNIASVVVGVSRKDHAKETFQIIAQHLNK